mmetsp:Transcript_19974/g.32487  ORF Transcript_19974/g.32487 Transcript_19974/m.32487 type:complete len:599 (-) Transcript_19974:222-2018(-)
MRPPSFKEARDIMGQIRQARLHLPDLASKTSKELSEALIWLAQGDYCMDYLRLESKRNTLRQVLTSLLAKKQSQTHVSAYQFQDFVQSFGNLEFLINRVLLSLIRICYPQGMRKARNKHQWYLQPFFSTDNRDEREIMAAMKATSKRGEYIIRPAHNKIGVFNLIYRDCTSGSSSVHVLPIVNVPEKARFCIVKNRNKEGKGVSSARNYYFTLIDIINDMKDELKNPFVDPDLQTTLNLRGTGIRVAVSMFLQPKFSQTRLYEMFAVPSSLNKNLGYFWMDPTRELLYDRDIELFNIILNIYRYYPDIILSSSSSNGGGRGGGSADKKKEAIIAENKILPREMPEGFYSLLKDEFTYWKLPYDVKIAGDKKSIWLTYNPGKRFPTDEEILRRERAAATSSSSSLSRLRSNSGGSEGYGSDVDGDFESMDPDDDMDDVEIFDAGGGGGQEEPQSGMINSMGQGKDAWASSMSGLSHDNKHNPSDNNGVEDADALLPIEQLKHAYEVLEGLPLFHEDPNGRVISPPFSAGDKVEYMSRSTGKWFGAVVQHIDMDEKVTVILNTSQQPKIATFGQLREKEEEDRHGYTAAVLEGFEEFDEE